MTINVTGPPVASNDNVSVSYTSTQEIDVLANDAATRGGINRTTVFLSAPGATPAASRTYTASNGIVFTVNATTGNITFTNPNRFVGTTSVAYNFRDNAAPTQLSNTGTLTLTLTNSAPVAANVTNTNANSDNGLTTSLIPGFSVTDPDGNTSIASYQIVSLPATGTLTDLTGGTTTTITAASLPYTISAANVANLRYNVADNTAGTFSFQYRATDIIGAQSNTATYTIPVVSSRTNLITTLVASASLTGPSVSTAPQGSLLYYTATTTNNGPGAANSATTTIFLPAGLTGISLSSSGTYDAATGRATFPAYTLAVGASVSRNIAFSMPGTTVNATASAVEAGQPNPGNVASIFTTPTQVADISVAINGPTRVLANQAVIYSVVPTNIGPSTATGVALRAQLATGLAGVIASGPGAPGSGSYNATTGVVTWPLINSLANGVSLVYTVRFNSPTTVGGTITASGSATSTTANGDPVSVNNDGTAEQSKITTQVVNQAATLLCINPGADGDVNLASNFNTYFPGSGTVNAGSLSIAVGPASAGGATTPIVAGDLLLIIQMQAGDLNTDNSDAYGNGVNGDNLAAGVILNANFTAGVYEYAIASGAPTPITGGFNINLTQGLSFSYTSAAATATSGQKRFQVIRVPRYRNVTLLADVTAPRWNGETGGVLALDVNGTLNLNGFKLDMAGRGFRGGAGQVLTGAGGVAQTDYRNSATLATSANKGEGITGTPRFLNDNGVLLDTRTATTGFPTLLPAALNDGYPNGDRGRGAPGNAGGGGTDGNPGANDQNTGGGGGSNAGRGGIGGNGWDSNSSTGGYGGAGFTQATASRIIMGGGAGAGTTNNATGAQANGFASSGAAGGGIVIIRATTVSPNAGTIDVSGSDMTYTPANDGSGGGGAGGSVVLLCNASDGNPNSTILNNLTILAKGGLGGSNTGGGSPHGPGGGGAGGVAFTSSPVSSASTLLPGANGTTFGFATYGSGVGSASLGQGRSNITRADLPNVVVGCPADVVTTITSSAAGSAPPNSAAPGATVTFTANTINNGPGAASNVRETITLAPNLAEVQPNGQTTPTSTDQFSGVRTYADGTTYDPATGVVTFPAIATLGSGITLRNATTNAPNYVSFVMPNQNVLGTAASRSGGDLDPRLANNDGSLPGANVKVTAVNSIAGTIFDDVNYGGGSGRDLAAANTSAVASGFASGAIGSPGTRVELYNSTGAFVAATTTGADGTYGFGSVAVGNYTVRVVSSTVKSVRNRTAAGVLPVQTYRTNNGAADTERVGGEDPTKVDGPANFQSVTLRLAGLNLSGGDNTAFADLVEIIDINGNVVAGALGNGSFETPNLGGTASKLEYGPTAPGVAWTLAAGAGIASNGSGFGTTAPDGTQVAFVQGVGTADQALNLSAGTYRVRFRVAQRNCCGANDQTLAVQINGSEIGRVQPANDGAYATYTSGTFTVGALGSGTVAQSIAPIILGSAGVAGVDFGFNFSTIVNTNDGGQGSLRQFIANSNALPNGNLDQAASSNAGGTDPAAGMETSIFMVYGGADVAGYTAPRTGLASALTGGVAVIRPTAAGGALPPITDANTVLDGTTQTINIGNGNNVTLGAGGNVGRGTPTAVPQLNGPEVQISGTPGQAGSDYGLTLAASNLTVKGLAILGFGNTGATTTGNPNGANIYVTGAATSGTLITGNVIGTGATSFSSGTGGDTDPTANSATTRSPGNGILLANLTSGVSVSATISGNLIGFNGASGIENLAVSSTSGLLISGNDIRRNAQLSPTADGIHMGGAGGTVQNNRLRANLGAGLDFSGSAGGILVTNNDITNSGVGGAAYTQTAGVRAFGQGNVIQLNNIVDNAGSGIMVLPGSNEANVEGSTIISRNSIATNGMLSIDLMGTGDSEAAGTVTLNDMGDIDGGKNSTSALGGNGLLNFPVIVQARINGTNLLLRGYARPGARLELFAVGATPDGSGFGEGLTYLTAFVEGNTTAANGVLDTSTETGGYSGLVNGRNQGSDNTNLFEVSIPLASLPSSVAVGAVLSATATFTGVGTSEFSGNVTVGSGPLPVELTAFEAQAVKLDAVLSWTTATEKNNKHFVVERSLDGAAYVAVGQVAGQGTKASPTSYTLTDAGIGAKASGSVYYRLRQVDTDGTSTYSPVRVVSFAKVAPAPAVLAINLYPVPVPAGEQAKLDLTALPASSRYAVQLTDLSGRTVGRYVVQGGKLEVLAVGQLASGSYLLTLTGADAQGQALRLTRRFTKE